MLIDGFDDGMQKQSVAGYAGISGDVILADWCPGFGRQRLRFSWRFRRRTAHKRFVRKESVKSESAGTFAVDRQYYSFTTARGFPQENRVLRRCRVQP
jgi:hypothetical protein